MSFTNNDRTRLNVMAQDTGLYDPAVHDNEIVALYDTDAQARTAQQVLVDAGVPEGAMQLVARTLGDLGVPDQASAGIWGALKSLFVPDEDRTAYSHAIARGHAMLIVRPTADVDRTMVVRKLETTDPIDFDARLEEWRQAGYEATNAVHDEYAPHASGDASEARPEDTRVGRRETGAEPVRVRSYVVDRPTGMTPGSERGVEARATAAEPPAGPEDKATTMGAQSSGTNASRP